MTTWTRQVLTFQALNSEFDNVLSNALTLISPLTGSLSAGSNDLTDLDELAFSDAAANATAIGRLRRNGANLTWHDGAARVLLRSNYTALDAGTDITGLDELAFTDAAANPTAPGRLRYSAGVTSKLLWHDGSVRSVLTSSYATLDSPGIALVPSAVSGTPAQHALYRENVVKGWVNVHYTTGVPAIAASFNVSSVVDAGLGQLQVVWDRDFATAVYANVATPTSASPLFCTNLSLLATSASVVVSDAVGNLTDPDDLCLIAIGSQ